MIQELIDLIYPPRCVICQDIVVREGTDSGSRHICTACKDKLSYVHGHTCMRCGKELEDTHSQYCFDCQRMPKSFCKGYPVFNYKEAMQSGVTALKYHNRKEYAAFYTDAMLEKYQREWKMLCLDAVIPVPVHESKLRKRGYNQAELLARPIAKALEIPCYTNLLLRVEATTPQKGLSPGERLANLKKAFLFVENELKLEKVLLVDDIYTSGATIEACTRTMREGGVSEVYYSSICIGVGRA